MPTTAEQFSQNTLTKLSDNSYSGELTQTIELALRASINQDIEFEYVNWTVYKGNTNIYELFGGDISFSVNIANVIGSGPENAGKYSIIADLISTTGDEEAEKIEGSIEITFTLSSVAEPVPNAIFIPFVAQVAGVENDIILSVRSGKQHSRGFRIDYFIFGGIGKCSRRGPNGIRK